MALQEKIFTAGTVGGEEYNEYALRLTVTEDAVSETGNSSTVSFKLQLLSGDYRFEMFGLGAEVKLNGTRVAYRNRDSEPQVSMGFWSTLEILSGTAEIPHNPDGSLDMAVEFSISMAAYSYTPGSISVTGETMTLTQIARASTIAASAANIEETSVVTVSRKNTGYTHSIRCKFGSVSGYLNEDAAIVAGEVKLTRETIVFPIPERFYNEIPDSPWMDCTLTCCTYLGDQQIGEEQTAVFRVTADPARCGPQVSGTVEDVNPDTVMLTDDAGRLIRYMSEAECTITATARKGASIVSRTVNGLQMEDTLSIKAVETGSFLFRAVDSRGYSAEYPVSAVLIPYVLLTLNAAAPRTDPTSGNAKLSANGLCYTGSFGAVDNAISVSYRIIGGDEIPVETEAENNGYSAETIITGLDYQRSHTLEITVSDALMSVTKNVTVKKGIPTFDWGEKDFAFHVPVLCDQSVSGMYIRTVKATSFTIQTRFEAFQDGNADLQSILLFGAMSDGSAVLGVISVDGAGGCAWSGSGQVTVAAGADGKITVRLPGTARDRVGLFSAQLFTIT